MIKMAGITLCLIVSGCWSDHNALDTRGVIHPTQIQALSNANFNSPPPDSFDWHEVRLPDNWNISRPDQGGGVWYRTSIYLPEDAMQSMGVFVANLSMNASIWWDGVQVESGGQMTKPYTRNWHTPLYASIGLEQLRQGHHWLLVRVHGYANDGAGLGAIYIGAEPLLLPIYNRLYFVQRTLGVIALSCTVLLALGALLLWLLQRRRNHAFIWIALASGAWAVVISNFVVLDPPMSRFYWESLVGGSIELYGLFYVILVFRLLGYRKPKLEWSLALLFASGWAMILLFGDDAVLIDWAMPMHTLVLLLTVYLIWLCLYEWYQRKNKNALVLALAMSIQLAAGTHDWWLIYFANQLDSVLIMQAGPTLTLLVVGIWMIYNFSQALQASETHTEHIEVEIARVTASLKLEQEQTERLQRKQVISGERERFTRELHDGLGGYLSSISSMLHDGISNDKILTDTVDKALLDMRLIMDGIGEECTDIGMILGMLKHRFSSQLRAWNIRVSWNMAELPMHCEMSDGHGLHLMRIIQEAITNAARHAHADWVEVRASLMEQTDEPVVCIEVIDNGCGWNEMPEFGNGLSNMRKRADIMQATLSMVSMPDAGVRISLIIPVSISG